MDTKTIDARCRPFYIRQGTADDARTLGSIAYRAFMAFNNSVNCPPEIDFKSEEYAFLLFQALLKEVGLYSAVAVDSASGQLLGSGFLHRNGAYLRSIWPVSVDPSSSDKGVGRMIMTDLIARAREQEARSKKHSATTAKIDKVVAASTSAGFPPRTDAYVRQMEEADVEECGKLFQKALGFDRSEDIKSVLGDKAWVLVLDSKILAYTTGFYRRHTLATDELNFVTFFTALLQMSSEHLPFVCTSQAASTLDLCRRRWH